VLPGYLFQPVLSPATIGNGIIHEAWQQDATGMGRKGQKVCLDGGDTECKDVPRYDVLAE